MNWALPLSAHALAVQGIAASLQTPRRRHEARYRGKQPRYIYLSARLIWCRKGIIPGVVTVDAA